MAKCRLIPYVIRLKNKETDSYENIKNISSSGLSFSSILEKVIKKYHEQTRNSKPFSDDSLQKIIFFNGEIIKNRKNNYSFIHTKVYSGEYGFIKNILDKNRGFLSGLIRRIKKEEVAAKNLALTYFENDAISERGFFIFNSHSLECYKTIFNNLIQQELNLVSSIKVNIEFHPIFNSSFAEKIGKGGTISEIQFISNEVPKDSAEHNFEDKNKDILKIENSKRFSLIFKGNKKDSLISLEGGKKKIKQITESIKRKLLNPKETIFYEGVEVPLEEIKITIALGNEKYPITFDKEGGTCRESLGLPRGIIKNGEIIYKEVYEICEKYAEDILKKCLI